MSEISTRALTAEEMLRLPDDGRRLELIEGDEEMLRDAGARPRYAPSHSLPLACRRHGARGDQPVDCDPVLPGFAPPVRALFP